MLQHGRKYPQNSLIVLFYVIIALFKHKLSFKFLMNSLVSVFPEMFCTNLTCLPISCYVQLHLNLCLRLYNSTSYCTLFTTLSLTSSNFMNTLIANFYIFQVIWCFDNFYPNSYLIKLKLAVSRFHRTTVKLEVPNKSRILKLREIKLNLLISGIESNPGPNQVQVVPILSLDIISINCNGLTSDL